MAQRSLDAVEHHAQLLTYILSEKAEHEIPPLLQQVVLAPVPSICNWIGEMLCAVDLHGDASIGAEQVHFEASYTIEGDRQGDVELETPFGFAQRL